MSWRVDGDVSSFKKMLGLWLSRRDLVIELFYILVQYISWCIFLQSMITYSVIDRDDFVSSWGAERLVCAVFTAPFFCSSLQTGCLCMKIHHLIQNPAGKVRMRIGYLNVFPLYGPSVKDHYSYIKSTLWPKLMILLNVLSELSVCRFASGFWK